MHAVRSRDIPVTISDLSDAERGPGGVSPRAAGGGRMAAGIRALLRAGLLPLLVGLALLAAPAESQARVIWTGDIDQVCADEGGWWDGTCGSIAEACESWWNDWYPAKTEIKDGIFNSDGTVRMKRCWYDPDGFILDSWLETWQVCFETGEIIGSWTEYEACGGVVPAKNTCPDGYWENPVYPKNERDPVPTAGNPILPLTGNKHEVVKDFQSVGPDEIAFRRFYNSLYEKFGGQFRGKWRSTYDRFIQFASNGIDAFLDRPNGPVYHFVNEAGTWAPAPNNNDVEYGLTPSGSSWQVTTPSGSVETYDSAGKLQSITTPRGYSQTLTYDANGFLTTVTDSYGRQFGFAYNADNRLSTLTLPGGKTIGYAWDSISRRKLTAVTYPDGSTLTYHYENADWPEHLTGITDENGVRYATWTYDSEGRAVSSTHAGGADQVTLAYDPANSKTTVTNALGKDTIYHYATVQGVSKVTQVEGVASVNCLADDSHYAYGADGYVASWTDREGNVTTYVRNDRGLETSRTEASGTPLARTVTTTWHPTLPLPTQIVWPDLTIDFTYDASGNLLTRTETDTTSHSVPYSTNGQTRTWTYTYTPAGQRASVDGPLPGTADTTTYTYDANGYLATATNPLGHVTEVLAVDDWGLPTSIEDVNDVVTTLAYDARGRLIQRTVNPGANQAVTGFAYDQAGQMVKITRPDGSVLNYAYDDAHRLSEVSNDLGEKIIYARDAMGNVTQEEIKSASGAIKKAQTRVFDELGRMLQSIGAGLQTTSFAYNKNDDLATTTDPKSNVTSNAYDALNRLIAVTDALTNAVGQDYDAAGNLVGVTDQRSLTTAYVHNGFGEVIRRTSPDTGITDYVYDSAGNVTQKTDARGVVTQYAYDAASRLAAKTFPASPSENVTYGYDDVTGGNYGVGRLTRIQDATGSTDYVYDARGNVVSETRTIGGQVYVTQYAWDAADNLTQMTYPSGRTVTYTRDTLGRVIYVSTRKSPTDPEHFLAAGIQYLPFGPISSMAFGNGQQAVFTYDQDYRLTGVSTTDGVAPAQDLAYAYDLASNITAITDGLDAARNQVFDYDALHRLTDATGLYGDIDYTYDGVGNRLSRAITVGMTTETETLSYDTLSNRLLNVVDGVTRALGYTANGNVATDSRGTGYEYLYNDANRMTEAKAGGVTAATYGVNDQGQRVVKTVAGATTHYHFDQGGALIAESDDAGVVVREYVSLAGLPLALIDAGTPTTPAEQAIDNGDPGASGTGTWSAGIDGTGYEGADYAYRVNGSGAETFTWTPTVAAAGLHQVYAKWPSVADDLGSTATYTVHHADGTDTVTLDQRQGGGDWRFIGSYRMQPGMGHRVELSDQADPTGGTSRVIIDDTHPDAVATGTWTTTSSTCCGTFNDTGWRYALSGTGDATFQWPASAVPAAGRYRMYARWTTNTDRATNAKYTVQDVSGPQTVTVNQQFNGGAWFELGVFDLAPGAGPVATLSNDADGPVIADAIYLVRASGSQLDTHDVVYLDNTHPDAVAIGTWTPSTSGAYLGSNYLFAAAGDGSTKFQWPASALPKAGRYRIHTRWARHTNRATNAKYRIYTTSGVQTVTVNQEWNGVDWYQLGVFDLAPGTGPVVELANDANEYVIADAIMLTHEPYGEASDELVIDNDGGYTGQTGGWNLETWYYGGVHWNANYRWAYAGASRIHDWYRTPLAAPGRYRVYARWNGFGSATNAPFTIYHDGGATTVRVNQTVNRSKWVSLGDYDLSTGGGTLVRLTGDANGWVVADAIKLVRLRNIEAGTWTYVNNTQATLTGTWTTSTSTTGGWYSGGDGWVYAASGSGESSIEFPMAVPEAGRYNILAHCPQAAANATAARYVVHHDGGTTDVHVNQTVNGWDWVPIGAYNLTPGAGAKVTLDNAQPGTVCADAIAFGRDFNDRRVVADAVKFVPNTAEAALTVHADHLGTPQKMTDGAGAVVWDAAYRPFGEEAAISGAETNNQRFPGQYFDQETGLHYNWFRDYDPTLGRYIQSDPIGLAGGLNTYAYVGGNPLSYLDPTGERGGTHAALWAAASALAGVASNLTSQCIDPIDVAVDVGLGVLDVTRAGGLISKLAQWAKRIRHARRGRRGGGKPPRGGGDDPGAGPGGNGPGSGTEPGRNDPADFIVDSRGTVVRNSSAGARSDLENAGFPGTRTTQTRENGTIHTGLRGKDGPMDVRIMDGQPGGDRFKGPRVVTTKRGHSNVSVRTDGSKFRNNEKRAQRYHESHIHLSR